MRCPPLSVDDLGYPCRSPVENICERLAGLSVEDIEAALVREWGAGPPSLVQPTEQHYPGREYIFV